MISARVMLDGKHKRYKSKPEGAAVGAVKKSVTSVIDASIEDIADRLGNGEAICPAVLHGIKADDFESQQLFMCDIDNGGKKNGQFEPLPYFDILNVDDALHICGQSGLRPCFAYYTYSNGLYEGYEGGIAYDVPKFRLAFMFDEPITDKETRDNLQLYLMSLFGDPDQSTKNADRLFFGSGDGACCYEDFEAVNELSETILKAKEAAGATSSPGSPDTSGDDPDDDEKLRKQNSYRDKYKTSDDAWRELLTEAINHIPCGDVQYTEWLSVEAACKNEGLGFSIWDQWSSSDPGRYNHDECMKLWGRSVKTGINGGYIIALAKKYGYEPPAAISKPKAEPEAKKKKALTVKSMADVAIKETEFLYDLLFPLKLCLIAAFPGAGKTMIGCYLAAMVSQGKDFFGFENKLGRAGKVIYFSSEDGYEDTIALRLRQCGANMKNINYVEFNDDDDFDFADIRLEGLVKEEKPDLIIFDTLQNFIGNVNMNAANETTRKMRPLVRISDTYNVCIVCICHFNKNEQGRAITRIIGSTDITGKCRSYLSVGTVPDNDEGLKYLSHEKSNVGKLGQTILFRIDDHGRVVSEGTSILRSDDYEALRRGRGRGRRGAPALDEVKQFIIRNMPEGKRPAQEMLRLFSVNGFADATCKRAKKELGITSRKEGFDGVWFWYAPEGGFDDFEPMDYTEPHALEWDDEIQDDGKPPRTIRKRPPPGTAFDLFG